jgi:hypothetical protein
MTKETINKLSLNRVAVALLGEEKEWRTIFRVRKCMILLIY